MTVNLKKTIDLISEAQQLQWAMAFSAVVEEGSFTAAAQRMGVSKALLSRQVRQLEQALDAQLLYRTTRRLLLTDAGELYLGHCRDWLLRVQSARQALAELREEVAGRLRLTVPTSFGGVFMAQAMLALRQQYPALEVELDLSARPHDLEAEGFDLAIRANISPPERLVARPLAEVADWLVAAPVYLAGKVLPQVPADLAAHVCLCNSHFSHGRQWAFHRDGELASVAVSAPLVANDYNLLRNFALQGAGIARLPSYLVAPDVAAGRLQRLLPQWHGRGQSLYLVYPQRLPQPARVRALVAFLQQWFATPEQAALLGQA